MSDFFSSYAEALIFGLIAVLWIVHLARPSGRRKGSSDSGGGWFDGDGGGDGGD